MTTMKKVDFVNRLISKEKCVQMSPFDVGRKETSASSRISRKNVRDFQENFNQKLIQILDLQRVSCHKGAFDHLVKIFLGNKTCLL